jgi:hypothetical protein
MEKVKILPTLAIKGHTTRGKEIIEILEMLGGDNLYNKKGDNEIFCYYITHGTNRINHDLYVDCKNNEAFYVISLEDFLNKYPYKIGDEVMVVNKHLNAKGIIKSLYWYPRENIIRYEVDLSIYVQFCEVNELKPYKGRNLTALAIRGHETRGKEVIEILEMLGGKNSYHFKGDEDKWFVLDGSIKRSDILFDEKGFTLEEFFAKFPYKVGDRVKSVYGSYGKVYAMKWIDDEIQYRLNFGCHTSGWYAVNELQPYKEKIVEEKLEQITLDIPNGYEFFRVDDDNKVVLTKKYIQYPKNYEDCCKVLGISYRTQLSYTNPDVERGNTYLTKEKQLLDIFMKLRICCNAYWKIAGEQMGLGKPWEPDWSSFSEGSYPTITKCIGKIIKTSIYTNDCLLAFPTEEMRDAFYENFKKEIEECKELL